MVCIWGVGVYIAPLIIKLGTKSANQLHAAAALAPVPFEHGIGWVPKNGWTLKRKEKSLVSVRNRNSVIRPVV